MNDLNKYYLYYCLSVLVGIIGSLIYVFIDSSMNGYVAIVPTNNFGEHWIEVMLLATAIPGILKILYYAIPSTKKVVT